jgi:hypothetical protein
MSHWGSLGGFPSRPPQSQRVSWRHTCTRWWLEVFRGEREIRYSRGGKLIDPSVGFLPLSIWTRYSRLGQASFAGPRFPPLPPFFSWHEWVAIFTAYSANFAAVFESHNRYGRAKTRIASTLRGLKSQSNPISSVIRRIGNRHNLVHIKG